MCKISVIIPVYNTESYVQSCLDSVISQSMQDLEVICVDDCGSDNSMAIVEEYQKKDERIKIIRHKKNRGLCPARNTGMKIAKGDYIFFLDSDDYIEANIFRRCLKTITETMADVLMTRTRVYGETANDESMDKRVMSAKKKLKFRQFLPYTVTVENFSSSYYSLPKVAWGRLYRLEFMRKKEITFIDKNIAYGDRGFYIKLLASQPKISQITEICVNHLIRAKSPIYEREQKDESWKDAVMAVKDAQNFIEQHGYDEYYWECLKFAGVRVCTLFRG